MRRPQLQARGEATETQQTRVRRKLAPQDVARSVMLGSTTGVGVSSNSTSGQKAVHSRAPVPASSRKASELTIEALYVSRSGRDTIGAADEVPDECERARLIGDITRLIREPGMCEQTRTAGLTLIGWLARRMPGEAAHAIGVSEAKESERRLRAAQRKPVR